MKFRVLLLTLLSFNMLSCYDDTALWESVRDHESRIVKLETICNQMNTNISSLKVIVDALQQNDYVSSSAPITENGKIIGYSIIFSSGKTITIYHGKNGEDGRNGTDGTNGTNGKDGTTPVIGVKADAYGNYYWTLNGEFLLDDNGNKLPAIGKDGEDGKDGITPQLKITEGYWYISYNNGESWQQLGKATSDEVSHTFKDIEYDETSLRLTMMDGTQIILPIKNEFALILSTCSLDCVRGKTYNVSYSISGADASARMTTMSEGGYSTSIEKTNDNSGDIIIKTNDSSVSGKVLVLLSQGAYTVVQTIEISIIGSDTEHPEGDGSMWNTTANCYIVSTTGKYSFLTVKGNSNESVGTVSSAEVLWESFGTDDTPSVGDLIRTVKYENGMITFETPEIFKEGNAVIAAKDSSGNILWSWHIWLTDQPEGQVYYNGAGTMMDRNLGATSATPSEPGVFGLEYQWGRKDPFIGITGISANGYSTTRAKSTITWNKRVNSDSYYGTIEFAISNPTTYIDGNDVTTGFDWYYTSGGNVDNTRWQTEKTIYDPCPSGWRVPDGGDKGVWMMASAMESFNTTIDSKNNGVDFSNIFGDAALIWYPVMSSHGAHYWSVTPVSYRIQDIESLLVSSPTTYSSSSSSFRDEKCYIRCIQESQSVPENPNDNLPSYTKTFSESANCYIVCEAGTYSFLPVKGNSNETVGSISTTEVLWETFGNYVTPSVGDLIKSVSYSNGYITFQTANTFKEGNAVIAAKDASGKILWSWHIWLTDQPEGQIYYNDAGTMMDRNLGATSATPNTVGALGLLYQWGRKDPFLNCPLISSDAMLGDPVAESTITWPSAESGWNVGTIEYSISHPTTFITACGKYLDWYESFFDIEDSRWQSEKTIYDPCPAGWRVPDGGDTGVWAKALGTSTGIDGAGYGHKGLNFSGTYGSDSIIWYPLSGYHSNERNELNGIGTLGIYWSVTSHTNGGAYTMEIGSSDGEVSLRGSSRAGGYSVRCIQE